MRLSANLDCGGSTPLFRRLPDSARSENSSPLFVFWGWRILSRHLRNVGFSSLRILCALCVSALSFPLLAQQPQLKIAAASDLKFAMTELATAYEKQSGIKLNLTFGSSGNFFAQIQNGAPFDLFFSADSEYPLRLEQAGLIVPGSTYKYAVGRIVLWSPNNSKADPAKSGWNSLFDPSVQKIAIANPDHAPYGRAALEALKKSGHYDRVKDKLVFGENISQAAQFVQSGNAQIGILAESLILSPSFASGHSWKIPQQQYAPLFQSAVLLKSSGNPAAARAFLTYLDTPPAKSILEKYGFRQSTSKLDPAL